MGFARIPTATVHGRGPSLAEQLGAARAKASRDPVGPGPHLAPPATCRPAALFGRLGGRPGTSPPPGRACSRSAPAAPGGRRHWAPAATACRSSWRRPAAPTWCVPAGAPARSGLGGGGATRHRRGGARGRGGARRDGARRGRAGDPEGRRPGAPHRSTRHASGAAGSASGPARGSSWCRAWAAGRRRSRWPCCGSSRGGPAHPHRHVQGAQGSRLMSPMVHVMTPFTGGQSCSSHLSPASATPAEVGHHDVVAVNVLRLRTEMV